MSFKYLTMLTKYIGDEGRPSRTTSMGLSNFKLRPIRDIIVYGITGAYHSLHLRLHDINVHTNTNYGLKYIKKYADISTHGFKNYKV